MMEHPGPGDRVGHGDEVTAFKADLAQLSAAIGTVKGEAAEIKLAMFLVRGKMFSLADVWKGPAHVSFRPVQDRFLKVWAELADILDETVTRMQASYDNYLRAEEANLHNLNYRTSAPGNGSHTSTGPGVAREPTRPAVVPPAK
ncbi:MAG TPA: WXG100 family type VII secretion target [Actinomadura sp.]|jgi:uncharacterized protein YukE|nr:WXG100 family type VII secretion target [Actinomadura sp.]